MRDESGCGVKVSFYPRPRRAATPPPSLLVPADLRDVLALVLLPLLKDGDGAVLVGGADDHGDLGHDAGEAALGLARHRRLDALGLQRRLQRLRLDDVRRRE